MTRWCLLTANEAFFERLNDLLVGPTGLDTAKALRNNNRCPNELNKGVLLASAATPFDHAVAKHFASRSSSSKSEFYNRIMARIGTKHGL